MLSEVKSLPLSSTNFEIWYNLGGLKRVGCHRIHGGLVAWTCRGFRPLGALRYLLHVGHGFRRRRLAFQRRQQSVLVEVMPCLFCGYVCTDTLERFTTTLVVL
jgi:hypothetical protein